MTRKYADPAGQWTLKIPVPYVKGVWHDDLIALSGQVDMKGDGIVQHPGDLETQTDIALGHIQTVLADLGASMADLTKLVVFYKTDGGVDEDAYRARLGAMIGEGAELAVTFVPLPNLGYPGMMVEIDGYGVKCAGRSLARRSANPDGLMPLGGPFVHGIRCGEMVFTSGQDARDAAGTLLHPGDSVTQSKHCLDNTLRILEALGADMKDAVKFNAYYRGAGTAEEWERSARVRASYFEEPGPTPTATGLPVHHLHPAGAAFRFDCWAMRGEDGSRLAREHVWPEGHWDWPIHLPYKHGLKCGSKIFVGGQVSLDPKGAVIDPGQMGPQTARAMDNIGRVLAGFGADFGDIVKQNSFYAGTDDPADLHSNVDVRSSYFSKPGPASTGVPLNYLAYKDMLTEIEAIAVKE